MGCQLIIGLIDDYQLLNLNLHGKMRKKNALKTKRIINYLSANISAENEQICLNELCTVNLFDFKKTADLKMLFGLLRDNKIELTENKRNRGEWWVKLSDTAIQSKEEDTVSKMIELYGFFSLLSNDKSWVCFEQLTDFDFISMSLSQVIAHEKLDPLDTTIFLRTIEGFLKGQHPVFLNDILQVPAELIRASIALRDEAHVLLKKDLIHVQFDQDGVSIRTTLTANTLYLLGEHVGKAHTKSQKMTHTLYEIIPHEKIASNNLFYGSFSGVDFEDFCALSKTLSKEDNLSILLHGKPGTGKTAFAHQLTKEVGGTLLQLNFSQIQSKWVGETEKNVRKVFAEYHENWQRSEAPVVLLINEADGFMNKRVQINTSIDAFSNHAQTELLEQLENFKGILIATTNLLDNIDNAFHRRFLFKAEIQPPCARLRANYLQDSSLTSLLSSAQMRLLESGSWTIAELKNLERKIQFLSRVKSLSDHELNALLIDSGLYGNNRKLIGFQLIGR